MKKVGIFLLILLLLPGCRKTVTEEQLGDDSVLAYYVNAAVTRLTGDAHKLQAADLNGQIEELYAVLQESGHGETVAAVPESLKLISQNVDSRILSLDLEGPYYEMSTATQVMCLAALTKTMTQLEEVDYIRLSVNGSPVTQGETEVGILRSGMFMDDIKDNPDSYIDTELVLYFASEDGRQLVKTTLSVGYQSGSSLERIVVEQLLRGPQVSGVKATLPSTSSLLGVNVRDGICYVNFDDKFISDSLSGGYDYIPVYSLVNSLTELPTVQKVQLMINSKTDVSYSDNISFAAPLERNMDYVGGEID
jgi:germination protein M